MGKVRQVLLEEECEINAVMEGKNISCTGILSDHRDAETASHLIEYTINELYSSRFSQVDLY